jgi:hypothetical protein
MIFILKNWSNGGGGNLAAHLDNKIYEIDSYEMNININQDD